MLKLIYITNRPDVAKAADNVGVDIVMIDLEKNGKAERQAGWNAVLSEHYIEDIPKVKAALTKTKLLVRVNPIGPDTQKEIDEVIANKADILMLPYFTTADEVRTFIDAIGGRAKACLLVETKGAVENLDEILSVPGIDEVHIGLNDLSHSYGVEFMFDMFPMGIVDHIVEKIKAHGITEFGIGGIAKLNNGAVPAENVIVEHYRLGSKYAILSRAFCNTEQMTDIDEITEVFETELDRIRMLESRVAQFDDDLIEYCRNRFNNKVTAVTAKED